MYEVSQQNLATTLDWGEVGTSYVATRLSVKLAIYRFVHPNFIAY